MSRTPWLAVPTGLLLASVSHADCPEIEPQQVAFNAADYCEAVVAKVEATEGQNGNLVIQQPWPKEFPKLEGECSASARFTSDLQSYAKTSCTQLLANPSYKALLSEGKVPKITVALNTNQAGRTLQDVSYAFRIEATAGSAPGTTYELKPKK